VTCEIIIFVILKLVRPPARQNNSSEINEEPIGNNHVFDLFGQNIVFHFARCIRAQIAIELNIMLAKQSFGTGASPTVCIHRFYRRFFHSGIIGMNAPSEDKNP